MVKSFIKHKLLVKNYFSLRYSGLSYASNAVSTTRSESPEGPHVFHVHCGTSGFFYSLHGLSRKTLFTGKIKLEVGWALPDDIIEGAFTTK